MSIKPQSITIRNHLYSETDLDANFGSLFCQESNYIKSTDAVRLKDLSFDSSAYIYNAKQIKLESRQKCRQIQEQRGRNLLRAETPSHFLGGDSGMFSLALMLYTIAVSYMNIIGVYGWNFEKGLVRQDGRINILPVYVQYTHGDKIYTPYQ